MVRVDEGIGSCSTWGADLSPQPQSNAAINASPGIERVRLFAFIIQIADTDTITGLFVGI